MFETNIQANSLPMLLPEPPGKAQAPHTSVLLTFFVKISRHSILMSTISALFPLEFPSWHFLSCPMMQKHPKMSGSWDEWAYIIYICSMYKLLLSILEIPSLVNYTRGKNEISFYCILEAVQTNVI